MPNTLLTPQQQALVDGANAVLAAAQKEYDAAISNFNALKNDFCNGGWWNTLGKCDIRNAQTKAWKWTVGASSILLAGLPALINNWTQKRWTPPTSCQEALDNGILTSWECHRQSGGDCVKKETCDTRVNDYNRRLNDIYNAMPAIDGANNKVQSAKQNLKNVLDGIAADPTTAGNIAANTAAVAGDKKAQMIKWLLFGLIALVIISGAIFLVVRMGKKVTE